MNLSELNNYWKDILEKLQSSLISQVSYILYFSKLYPYTVNGDTLVLITSLNSHKVTIMNNFREQLLKVIKDLDLPFNDFVVILDDEKDNYTPLDNKSDIKLDDTMPFIKDYTFDNFVVGDSNRLAYMACAAIAENPGENFNPLFIYSPVGLGKTHLLNSIGNYLKIHSPDLKVIYITAENFTNDYIYSIRNNKNTEYIRLFNDRYRNSDVLMIDDVQFLERTEKTQDALFYIFNDLYAKNKQIIISSDRPIQNLTKLDDRLTSRFQSGFSVDITYPQIEDRLAILQKETTNQKYEVTQDVLYYLAITEKQNIRILKGMLKTVGLYGKLNKMPIDTVEKAKDALRSSCNTTEDNVTIQTITDATSTYFNIKTSDIIDSRSRAKKFVLPRQYAMYLITEILPDIPLAKVGEFFSRDHSTVINSRDKIGKMIDEDENVKKTIEDIKNMVFNK